MPQYMSGNHCALKYVMCLSQWHIVPSFRSKRQIHHKIGIAVV